MIGAGSSARVAHWTTWSVLITTLGFLALHLSPTATADSPAVRTPPASLCLKGGDAYIGDVPWALRRLAPQRVWPLSRGEGVTVAVLGTGIDGGQPQFVRNQVLPGKDFLATGPADDDCVGTGTFVAGLIAAAPRPDTTVVGLAPAVRLLPVRVFQNTERAESSPTAALLADGIDYAVTQGARVIVIYESAPRGTPRLAKALAEARAAGSVVVAGGTSAGTTTTGATLSFPCEYPQAIAVAGIDLDGNEVAGSCRGRNVDIAAPGAGLVSTAAGADDGPGHRLLASAPGYAAGYVAAAVALLLAYDSSTPADKVERLLCETADPTSTARHSDELVCGVVNPYALLAALPTPERQPEAVGRGDRLRRAVPVEDVPASALLLLASGLLVLAAAVPVVVITIRRASERGWRPGARHPSHHPASVHSPTSPNQLG
jgi:membrane-anchored mycosin MYCP